MKSWRLWPRGDSVSVFTSSASDHFHTYFFVPFFSLYYVSGVVFPEWQDWICWLDRAKDFTSWRPPRSHVTRCLRGLGANKNCINSKANTPSDRNPLRSMRMRIHRDWNSKVFQYSERHKCVHKGSTVRAPVNERSALPLMTEWTADEKMQLNGSDTKQLNLRVILQKNSSKST